MTYTQLALFGVVLATLVDLYVLRTRILTRAVFWTSYAIIVPFQLLTNGVFTGTNIVQYDEDSILGVRIAFAPVEDLLFGYALVVLSLSVWVALGRAGVQRTPISGPPRAKRFAPRR